MQVKVIVVYYLYSTLKFRHFLIEIGLLRRRDMKACANYYFIARGMIIPKFILNSLIKYNAKFSFCLMTIFQKAYNNKRRLLYNSLLTALR